MPYIINQVFTNKAYLSKSVYVIYIILLPNLLTSKQKIKGEDSDDIIRVNTNGLNQKTCMHNIVRVTKQRVQIKVQLILSKKKNTTEKMKT